MFNLSSGEGGYTAPGGAVPSLGRPSPNLCQPDGLHLAEAKHSAAGDDDVVINGDGARLVARAGQAGLDAPRLVGGAVGLHLVRDGVVVAEGRREVREDSAILQDLRTTHLSSPVLPPITQNLPL